MPTTRRRDGSAAMPGGEAERRQRDSGRSHSHATHHRRAAQAAQHRSQQRKIAHMAGPAEAAVLASGW